MSLLKLDHLAVTSETLGTGASYTETALGVTMALGGEHDAMGTHNKLLNLGPDLYLETIAINPEVDAPSRPRWFDLDNRTGPPRLTNWICRTDDLDAALNALGLEFGDSISFKRGDLRWKMAVPKGGILPFGGWAPALIEWQCEKHPASTLSDQGVRLEQLSVCHPKADVMEALLAPYLATESVQFRTETHPKLDAQFKTPAGPVSL